MHTKNWRWLEKGPWIFLLGGAAAILWIRYNYYNLVEVDWLSYVNVAELYANGKFGKAINGYWSPLYSWILVPFIKLGADPHLPSYCINSGAAIACFYFLQRLCRRYLTNSLIYLFFQICLIVLLLYFALSELTPDLMGTAFVCYFLSILASPGFYTSYRLPVWAGVCGAVCYLAKSYNFLFVQLLLILLLLGGLISSGRRRLGHYRFIIVALAVFWAVSLLWIVPLSIHEQKTCFSTAGVYSHNYAGPGHPGHPVLRKVIEPPFEEAHTAWFNASRQLDDHPWSSFGSKSNLIYQLCLIVDNVIVMAKVLNEWYVRIDVLLVCMLLIAWYNKQIMVKAFTTLKLWWLALLIYPLGYLPLFVEGRYLYIEALLIVFFFFYLLQEMGALLSENPGKRR
ncbi:MAG: hypothetical protein JST39_22285, partial [Bacteroidetes bacterium]|nr:hypothetical protein [Bacteroidota bacterium]